MSSRITVDPTNRTFICSVVFVDLVGYSKKSVSEQLAVKDRFTALLADALKDIAVNDRIVLDTGDGAAMSFLGDPEDALFVGMSVRDAMKGAAAQVEDAGTGVRIGINLGPVRLVQDINGHPNIVGDGINVAQRIMSFAEPGQILASRSYYDVVSCLSDEYAKLFEFEGSRTDKHVREHEVYVVGESESAFIQAKTGMEHRAAQTNPRLRAKPEVAGSGMQAMLRRFSADAIRSAALAFVRDRKKVSIAGGVLGALVLLLAVLLGTQRPAAPPPPASTAAPAASAATAAQPAKPDAAAKAAAEPSAAKLPAQAAAAPSAAAIPEAKRPLRPEPLPGTVHLSIAPWGEVLVNGKSQAVSPPIKSLKLAPGKYKIEVRNTTFTPYVAIIHVKSREEVTIRHVFK
jgi:class 3 adenylate cyclase